MKALFAIRGIHPFLILVRVTQCTCHNPLDEKGYNSRKDREGLYQQNAVWYDWKTMWNEKRFHILCFSCEGKDMEDANSWLLKDRQNRHFFSRLKAR
jgi:hypothetical protein